MSALGLRAFAGDWVRIPQRFVYDHQDRGLPTPTIEHENASHYWIRKDAPEMAELINDAEFYADPSGPDEAPHIVRAAKALLRALKQAHVPGVK